MAKTRRRSLLDLQRFAEEGSIPNASAETGVTGSDAETQTTQDPQPALRTRRGTPIYGASEETPDATVPEGQAVPVEQPSAETYESLVKGQNARFKAEYDQDVQAIVQSRLRASKAREAKVQSLLEVLGKRYNIDVSDAANLDYEELTAAVVADEKYLESEAAEQGLSPEQLATIKRLQWQVDQRKQAEQVSIEDQRRRALFDRIAREAEEAKGEFPSLDIRTEIANPNFIRMMETGVPVRAAYVALHPELMQQVASAAAQAAQQRVSAQIQSGMRRPTENGIGGQSASMTDIDVRDPKVRQELKRRVRAGEKVVLP